MTAKISKSFRLSAQAIKNLEQIVLQTGSSDTAIVEMALAHFAKVMQLQDQVIPEPEFPKDGWSPVPVHQPNSQPARQPNHKKKKW